MIWFPLLFIFVFVFKRGEKKSIVAKLIQNSSITCMLWLPDGQIVFGLADGKVKSHKALMNEYQNNSFN